MDKFRSTLLFGHISDGFQSIKAAPGVIKADKNRCISQWMEMTGKRVQRSSANIMLAFLQQFPMWIDQDGHMHEFGRSVANLSCNSEDFN